MTNAHSETGQMAVCCQNLTLGAVNSRSALSVVVGALFKKFRFFLNTPRILQGRVQTSPTAAAVAAVQHSAVHTLFKVVITLFSNHRSGNSCCFHHQISQTLLTVPRRWRHQSPPNIFIYQSARCQIPEDFYFCELPQRRSASCPSALR